MLDTVKVNYQYTNILYNVHKYLKTAQNHPIIAWDFETANKCTSKELELLKVRYELNPTRELLQQIEADGLSHPSLSCITHLSVAWSPSDAVVIVCDTELIRRTVYNWLVTIDNTQLIHNSSFDLRHVIYHTGKLPKHFIDTRLLAKSLINNANNMESAVDLKGLMGHKYGDWALSDDTNFTLANIYDAKMIKYSAIDSCATWALYEDINQTYPPL